MTELHVNYSICQVCGKDFTVGEPLVARVAQATPGGDSLLQFVHAACALPRAPRPK